MHTMSFYPLCACAVLAVGCSKTDESRASDALVATADTSPPSGIIATDQGQILAVAELDPSHVAWVRLLDGRVTFLSKAGSATPVELDSVPLPDPNWGTEAAIAHTDELWLWSPPARNELRFLRPDGSGLDALATIVTDLDAEGDLVVFTDHNAGLVTWTDSTRLTDRAAPLATATVEFASGVATDGARTWVIERLAAQLLRFDTPGAEPVMAAFWPGDNTMDLFRGAAGLTFWNHAKGTVLTLSLDDGASLVEYEPARGAAGRLAITDRDVYGTTGDFEAPSRAWLWSAPLGGGDAVERLTLGDGCMPSLAPRADGTVIVSHCGGRIEVWP